MAMYYNISKKFNYIIIFKTLKKNVLQNNNVLKITLIVKKQIIYFYYLIFKNKLSLTLFSMRDLTITLLYNKMKKMFYKIIMF